MATWPYMEAYAEPNRLLALPAPLQWRQTSPFPVEPLAAAWLPWNAAVGIRLPLYSWVIGRQLVCLYFSLRIRVLEMLKYLDMPHQGILRSSVVPLELDRGCPFPPL